MVVESLNQTKQAFTFYSNKQNLITTGLLSLSQSCDWWSLICCVSSRRDAMSWRCAKIISHHKPTEACSDCHVMAVSRSLNKSLTCWQIDMNLILSPLIGYTFSTVVVAIHQYSGQCRLRRASSLLPIIRAADPKSMHRLLRLNHNIAKKIKITHPRDEQSSAKWAADDVLQLANDILPDGTAMIR